MVRLITRLVYAGLFLTACKHEALRPSVESGFPEKIEKIFLTKCATAGCHNSASAGNAAGLNLSSWDELFKGAGTGAVVMPYRPDFSSLCYFINTDTSLGISLQPTMPLFQPPLTVDEYLTIRNWIASGAGSSEGKIAFAENPGRRKYYVCNKMCDVVTVVDAATGLQMRYVDVGFEGKTEFPSMITVAPDRKSWYVGFAAPTRGVQQFNAATDQLTGTITLPEGVWTSMVITPDSKYAYIADNSSPGKLAMVDLSSLEVVNLYSFDDSLHYPAGMCLSSDGKQLLIGTTSGNFVHLIDLTTPGSQSLKRIIVDESGSLSFVPGVNPAHIIQDSHSESWLIGCSGSGELVTIDAENGKQTGVVSINQGIGQMVASGKLLFLSCPDDLESFPGNRGAVVVVDLDASRVIKRINSGYQPYGLVVDSENEVVVVVNANISIEGPDSHHTSGCGEKNGNLSFIDLQTLELIPGSRRELAVFPYSIGLR